MQEKRRRPKQSSGNDVLKDDLRASFKVIGWLNDTLDAAAKLLGKQAGRDAVMALLILHKNPKARNGKKFLHLYRTWRAARGSEEIEESLRVALGQLLRAGLVTVGEIGGVAVSELEPDDLQVAIGKLLEGLQGLRKIQLTNEGRKRIKLMRQTISQRLRGVRKDLTTDERRVFDKLIKRNLPNPRPRLEVPHLTNESAHG